MNRLRAPGFARYVLPAVVYAAAIFVGGSLPQGPDAKLAFAFQDKLLHLLAFGGFAIVVWRALRHLWPAKERSWVLGVSLGVAAFVGGMLELWQALLPTRSAEALDWLADVAGALLAVLGLWRVGGTAPWSALDARAPVSKR